MTYDSDTEVFMHFLSREVQSHKPWEDLNFKEKYQKLLTDFDGSWNISFLNADGKMVVVRDPLGLKPLCWGVSKDGILVFSSESVVLSNMQIDSVDLERAVKIKENEYKNICSRSRYKKYRNF